MHIRTDSEVVGKGGEQGWREIAVRLRSGNTTGSTTVASSPCVPFQYIYCVSNKHNIYNQTGARRATSSPTSSASRRPSLTPSPRPTRAGATRFRASCQRTSRPRAWTAAGSCRAAARRSLQVRHAKICWRCFGAGCCNYLLSLHLIIIVSSIPHYYNDQRHHLPNSKTKIIAACTTDAQCIDWIGTGSRCDATVTPPVCTGPSPV